MEDFSTNDFKFESDYEEVAILEAQKKREELQKIRIDLTNPTPEPKTLIKLNDAILFSEGNISCITGKAKSRKTFLSLFFVAEYLMNNEDCGAVIFDTEQARYKVEQNCKKVLRMMGYETDRNFRILQVYSLQEYGWEKRQMTIFDPVYLQNVKFVVIDGLADICLNYNDLEKSRELVENLLRFAREEQIHICCIMHQNPLDVKVRGHLGTELLNKSETVIECVADGAETAVKPLLCRNAPFEEFRISVDDRGLPVICEGKVEVSGDNRLDIRELLQCVIGDDMLSYMEIVSALEARTGYSKKKCEKMFSKGREEGWLVEASNKRYMLLSEPDLSPDDDCPFSEDKLT